MPKISERIFPKSQISWGGASWGERVYPKAPFNGYDTPLSPPGNLAPNRGLLPPEFMYDFATQRFYPESFQFTRGSVDINTPIRNLALQAAVAAGVKIT